ncbi:MAG: hypothetical protein A3J76_04585 [Candidatus Moranbacteria bacterium RBG_13_45_13]|nr:MAG: hypothetical protein A3J76_04585 [Candidatus Moranbacteria bacterium RBG_13_45_13]
MDTQCSFSLIKPDAFKKRIWFLVIKAYQEKGIKITKARFIRPERQVMENLYAEHAEKPFYSNLINFMTEGRLALALEVRGKEAVEVVRDINFEIRARYASEDNPPANVVHGSDSHESAVRELKIFFGIPES